MRTKSFSFLGSMIIVVAVHAQQFSNTMSYKTSIIQLNSLVSTYEDGYRYEGIPFQDHIMVNDRQEFIYNLMYNAGDDKKPVYQAGSSTRLTAEQVLDQYCFYDTTMIQDPVTFNYIDTVFRGCQELWVDIKSLQFNETWSYSKTGSFFKKVNYVEPLMTVYDRNNGGELGTRSLIRQQGGWSGFEAQPITKLIKYRVMIKDTASIPTEIMKETERNTWVEMIRSMAVNGKLKVYDPYTEEVQLQKDEIKSILVTMDSAKITRPYPPYNEFDTVFVTSKWDQISAIDFYESWSFDKNGNITKEVLAYKPLAAIYDPNTAELRGFLPVFLVYNNDKARQKLWSMNLIWKRL